MDYFKIFLIQRLNANDFPNRALKIFPFTASNFIELSR